MKPDERIAAADPPPDWKPIPDDARARAMKADGTIVEYSELRQGDIYRAVEPPDWKAFNVETLEYQDDFWMMCDGDPVKGYLGQDGWGVPYVAGALDELRRMKN